MPSVQNLFADLPTHPREELFDRLAESERVRIERIVSRGHASPEGFWHDQPQHEFVLLLKGAARLRFEDHDSAVELQPGDYVMIPAHCRQRVEWTTPAEPTVWLAVHYVAQT